MHGLAIDSGCNHVYADVWPDGPPVFQAAPFDRSNSVKGGPYSEGVAADSETQYSLIDIAEHGHSIDVDLRGYSVDGESETEVISYSYSIVFGTDGLRRIADGAWVPGMRYRVSGEVWAPA